MSLCLCKVCINAALCDEAPAVFVNSAILSLTAVSCKNTERIFSSSKIVDNEIYDIRSYITCYNVKHTVIKK